KQLNAEEELSKGGLFATGLVAGGAVVGVVIAFVAGTDGGERFLKSVSAEGYLNHALIQGGYFLLGALFFAFMGVILYRVVMKKAV
ncbi:peptide transporter, partial|uniref:hypothetical protein n=1 Tax=Escherichia coli TaxID=562 RepID=UPI0016AF09A8